MWVLTDFLSPAYDLVSRTRYPCFRNKQKTEQILNLKIRAVVCLQLRYIISAFTALRKDFLTLLEIHCSKALELLFHMSYLMTL